MGIQGLLPFLANSTREAHISEFENQYVAIDAYCWLHKGIYSCAFELAMKKRTSKYVTYCMRYIEMLLHFKVKPILVFDGRHLVTKSETEKKRREERRKKFEKGTELLKAGKQLEGRKLLGESVDVSHELALNLIKKCREKNIDCIVAPHEADAQLAFLNIKKIAQCVITEDSDLLAYGSEKVMFKMDTSGRGKLIEKSRLHFSLNMTPEDFNEDIFRYMCILSGCDYLPSLPTIGPVNSLKFVKMLKGNDIYNALPKLPLYINKLSVKVTPEYILGFKQADATFKHQLVYDPLLRQQVPLYPAKSDDDIVGTKLPDDLAFNLAVGNIDPVSMRKVDNFDPDKDQTGFTILWKTDLIPSVAPRSSLIKSWPSLIEAKKRQRDNLEYETVQSITNDLKKQRIPLSTGSIKTFFQKNTVQSIPVNGFDFDPKISNHRKANVSKSANKTTTFSRYYKTKKDEERDKQIASSNDKRKDETNENYMERLLDEYFPPDAEETKKSDESRCCGLRDEKVLENICPLCEKCHVCCTCLIENGKNSDTQDPDECIRNVEKHNKNGQEDGHFLLDEIIKEAEKEDNLEKSAEKEEEEKSGNESPGSSLRHNFSKVLSRFYSTEKENAKTELTKEKSPEVNSVEKEEPRRTPSPVFMVRKDARVLNTICRLQNLLDTTGSPTSIYFSSSDSGSSNRSSSQGSSSQTPTGRKPQNHSSKTRSAPAKVGRSQPNTSTVNRTLFHFGFKKEIA